MQTGVRRNRYAFGFLALAVTATALSAYMLAKYVSNPFELDLLRSELVRTKLRLVYYPTIVSAVLTPVLVAWATVGMRRRALVTSLCAVLALLLIVWASHSVMHLWAELGGEGLP